VGAWAGIVCRSGFVNSQNNLHIALLRALIYNARLNHRHRHHPPDPVAAACLNEVRDRLEAARAEVGVMQSAFKESRDAAAAVRSAR